MFTIPFSNSDVCPGDWTICTVDGTDYWACIKYDPDASPYESECYTGKQVKAWERDNWYFVGVVIRAERGGMILSENLTSLWGIESYSSPEYFLEVANDLLREATPLANEARKRIALAMV